MSLSAKRLLNGIVLLPNKEKAKEEAQRQSQDNKISTYFLF